jgi:hypothetical protein
LANRIVTMGVINGVGDGDPLATITGLAPGVINFEAADVLNPTINGGSGANLYTITGTPTTQPNGNYGPTITLNAGAGADIINVLGMGLGTGLTVNGQGADDTMTVNYTERLDRGVSCDHVRRRRLRPARRLVDREGPRGRRVSDDCRPRQQERNRARRLHER